MGYPGLFNSSYHPSPLEEFYINTPTDQLGPVVTGQIVVALLQGVLFVQYWTYIGEFWNEKRWTKWLVHLTFTLCVAKFAYVWYFGWDRFVPHYGDWLYLAMFSPIAVPIGISSTLPSAVCQIFFIYRCWALSRNLFFALPATAALLVALGSGISLTYGSALAAGGNVEVTKLILTSINVSLASGLACDLLITTFTCFYLLREKTGFQTTDKLVSRLVKCSIESAAGPTIVALITLILSNKATNNQWFLVPNLALSHVYGCSLLYSVNARRVVQLGSQPSIAFTRSKPLTRSAEFPMQDRSRNTKQEVVVEVQTVVRQDRDTNGSRRQQLAEPDMKKGSQDDDSYNPTDDYRDKPTFFV